MSIIYDSIHTTFSGDPFYYMIISFWNYRVCGIG
jgi:hypothetical protein